MKKIALLLAGFFVGVLSFACAESTTVTISPKELVKDCHKFGVNIYNDPYFASSQAKNKAATNFEGSLYRQCLNGPGYDAEGFDSAIRVPAGSPWYECLKGADFTILSGPAKWQKGKIKDFQDIEISLGGKTVKGSRILFEQPLKLAGGSPCPAYKLEKETERAGVLVENLHRTKEGNLAGRESFTAKGNCKILNEGLRPGGFGYSALLLDPAPPPEPPADGKKEDKTSITFNTCFQKISDNNGVWHVRFWGKAMGGDAKLNISTGKSGEKKDVALGGEWKQHDITLKVDKLPKGDAGANNHLTFVCTPDAPLAIDDVEIWKEGDTNPTVFTDATIAAWKECGVGILRQPRMGGSTMENYIRPGMQKYKFESSPFFKPGAANPKAPDNWGLHEILVACEYLGIEPWWNLPGTLQPEEMDLLMEYLGGDTTTKGGKLRAELGREKPWTDSSIKRFHIEIGNEAWNTDSIYLAGGFNGADYWHDLFARLKKSPYYKADQFTCHASGQNYSTEQSNRILGHTKSEDGKQLADRYAVALYQGHGMSQEELAALDTDEKLLRWMFAVTMNGYLGKPFQKQMEASKKHGVEFSMYEINHHLSAGNAPVEPREKAMLSAGGGIGIINTMLGCLKYGGMRDQCIFRWQQEFNSVPNLGKVRMWGVNLTADKDRVRYRPFGLAFQMVNRVIGGSLLETKQEGANPTFQVEVPGKKGKPPENFEFPVIHSYAFADGKNRSLLLFNFDLANEQEVEVKFDGTARGGAQVQRLVSTGPAATNEFDAGAPSVKIAEEKLPSFASGTKIKLAPCSMVAVAWEAGQ